MTKPMRRIATFALTTATVFTGMATVNAPANAAAPGDAAAILRACGLEAGNTHRSGNEIVGSGRSTGSPCAGRFNLEIQRKRWLGWETVKKGDGAANGTWQYIRYNCAKTGTHTFRTLVKGRIAGKYLSDFSNETRQNCGK
ncbi:hypothetical protein GCM10010123_30930 [Pilimelia anulata]|uniref:Secreted protein n=1 Tax=Pilimelia anulata TaxID=53371 RepID=A0A8J3FE47_9ACTN|nr:hypothetical protein [Pilimelia anulata]GGJ98809.1 hypothetical protein GCM10010123_30930 [Pilimelia anulata]